MAFVRRVRTASGATAVQIAEYAGGRQRIVKHLGSAHTAAELGLLLEAARVFLADAGQDQFALGVEPALRSVSLVDEPSEGALFATPGQPPPRAAAVSAARVLATGSGVLFDALAGVYAGLGFDAVGDNTFRDLVISRIVEPTSIRDTGRVLEDLGVKPVSEKTLRRTLTKIGAKGYRDQIATACFTHAVAAGDVSLVLYDVTTLYFEAEKEDELRKVGYSKERRVDPQIVVGLLVDRRGFPLEIGCFEGNKAETLTLIPIIKAFQDRHHIADMVVVADAGMLSAGNLAELDEAGLRFIVGSRVTKAPIDLESHFRWHGDAFTGGQVIDTIENRANAVVAGEKAARTPRFVKTTNGARSLDQAALERARRLVGLKGYVTNIDAATMPAEEVIASYHDLWQVEQSFRMSKTDLRARPMFHHTRDAIEAHLTIVFTALAVSREAQALSGFAIRNLVRQLRLLRSATIEINGAVQTFPPAIPADKQTILDALNHPRVTH